MKFIGPCSYDIFNFFVSFIHNLMFNENLFITDTF